MNIRRWSEQFFCLLAFMISNAQSDQKIFIRNFGNLESFSTL